MTTRLEFVRVIRTSASERFLGQTNGVDAVAFDVHYTTNGKIAVTAIVLNEKASEAEIQAMLQQFDEAMLPDANIADGGIIITVVKGRVLETLTSKV